jgi:hypothetical protein
MDDRAAKFGLTGICSGSMPTNANKKPKADSDAEAKTRHCLICKARFVSQWAGERICRRCKSTAAWRSGAL